MEHNITPSRTEKSDTIPPIYLPEMIQTTLLTFLAIPFLDLDSRRPFMQYFAWEQEDLNILVLSLASYVFLRVTVLTCVSLWRVATNFSKDIPGPWLAKITILWKLYHCFKGTYATKVFELHRKHGGVIQVGPDEYSIGDFQPIPWSSELRKIRPSYSSLFHAHIAPFADIKAALKMANIFRYEPAIERCNSALLKALSGYAESGEDVKLVDIIARYAYDAMFATTVGQAPGFLTQPLDVSKLIEAMENWKFLAVLHGSYLRFHPIIAKVVRVLNYPRSIEYKISKYLHLALGEKNLCALKCMRNVSDGKSNSASKDLEACIAIVLAGSDPTITHIATSLYYIYRDTNLLTRLRDEIASANMGQNPKFKELIHKKPQMPLLHAVLQESLRLMPPQTADFTYTRPEGDFVSGDKTIPGGSTICLEPSIVHTNPNTFGETATQFDPDRWPADPAQVRTFRHNSLAFGAGTSHCPGQDLHTAVIAELLTQIIPTFDIKMSVIATCTSPVDMSFYEFNDRVLYKDALPETIKVDDIIISLSQTTRAVPNVANNGDGNLATDSSASPTLSDISVSTSSSTPVGWLEVETLEDLVGRPIAGELFSRFDPSSALTTSDVYVETLPIPNNVRRAMTHDIIERIWSGRLVHETKFASSTMCIYVPGSDVPRWLQQLHARRQKNPINHSRKDTSHKNQAYKNTTAPRLRPAAKPFSPATQSFAPATRTQRPVDEAWGGFAKTEHTFITTRPYNAPTEAEVEAKKKALDAQPPSTVKETFKLTDVKNKNGKLGGPRDCLVSERTERDSKGAFKVVDQTAINAAMPNTEAAGSVSKPKAFVPPHLRKAAANIAKVTVDTPNVTADTPKIITDTWVAAKLPLHT